MRVAAQLDVQAGGGGAGEGGAMILAAPRWKVAYCGSARAQLPPLGRRQLLVRTDSRGASVSVLWWLHDRHWKQFNHPATWHPRFRS
jgi:hypothetical protein